MSDSLDTFTKTQRRKFEKLRDRYAEGLDRFTTREMSHLEFLRWLRETGMLQADLEGGDAAEQGPHAA